MFIKPKAANFAQPYAPGIKLPELTKQLNDSLLKPFKDFTRALDELSKVKLNRPVPQFIISKPIGLGITPTEPQVYNPQLTLAHLSESVRAFKVETIKRLIKNLTPDERAQLKEDLKQWL